jgi:hypothetical protein
VQNATFQAGAQSPCSDPVLIGMGQPMYEEIVQGVNEDGSLRLERAHERREESPESSS